MANKSKPPPSGWLWSADAADYIGVHVVTLRRYTREGIGPKAKRHGLRRYAYKITDLDAWLNGENADDEPARLAA